MRKAVRVNPKSAPQSHAVNVRRGNARASAEAMALDARRAASALGFGVNEVRDVLDADAATAASIHAGEARIPPGSELAGRTLLLVRLHRALGDVYGSLDQVNAWLDAEEPALHARPRELIRSQAGLRRVVEQVEGRCKDCLW